MKLIIWVNIINESAQAIQDYLVYYWNGRHKLEDEGLASFSASLETELAESATFVADAATDTAIHWSCAAWAAMRQSIGREDGIMDGKRRGSGGKNGGPRPPPLPIIMWFIWCGKADASARSCGCPGNGQHVWSISPNGWEDLERGSRGPSTVTLMALL